MSISRKFQLAILAIALLAFSGNDTLARFHSDSQHTARSYGQSINSHAHFVEFLHFINKESYRNRASEINLRLREEQEDIIWEMRYEAIYSNVIFNTSVFVPFVAAEALMNPYAGNPRATFFAELGLSVISSLLHEFAGRLSADRPSQIRSGLGLSLGPLTLQASLIGIGMNNGIVKKYDEKMKNSTMIHISEIKSAFSQFKGAESEIERIVDTQEYYSVLYDVFIENIDGEDNNIYFDFD